MSTTFQAPCGCLVSLDGGQSEACPIHELEGLSPVEALGMNLRMVLGGETEDEARAAILALREPSDA